MRLKNMEVTINWGQRRGPAAIALLRAALLAGHLHKNMTIEQAKRSAHPAGESVVEHQDSVLQVERAFPAIRDTESQSEGTENRIRLAV